MTMRRAIGDALRAAANTHRRPPHQPQAQQPTHHGHVGFIERILGHIFGWL